MIIVNIPVLCYTRHGIFLLFFPFGMARYWIIVVGCCLFTACGGAEVSLHRMADSRSQAVDKVVISTPASTSHQELFQAVGSSQGHLELLVRNAVIPKTEGTEIIYPYALIRADHRPISLFLDSEYQGVRERDYNRYWHGNIKSGAGFSYFVEKVTIPAGQWRDRLNTLQKNYSPEQDWQELVENKNYLGRYNLQEEEALLIWLGYKGEQPLTNYEDNLKLEVNELDE